VDVAREYTGVGRGIATTASTESELGGVVNGGTKRERLTRCGGRGGSFAVPSDVFDEAVIRPRILKPEKGLFEEEGAEMALTLVPVSHVRIFTIHILFTVLLIVVVVFVLIIIALRLVFLFIIIVVFFPFGFCIVVLFCRPFFLVEPAMSAIPNERRVQREHTPSGRPRRHSYHSHDYH
jgi:hypothetical protein